MSDGSTYLAIDVGSTFIKSTLLDVDAIAVTTVRQIPTPPRCAGPRREYEVDVDAICDLVVQAIGSHAAGGRAICGILLSTQTHGFVIVDAAGNPVTRYVSWQDTRCLDPMDGAGSYLDHLNETVDDALMRRSGLALKPNLALSNLFAWWHAKGHSAHGGSDLYFRTLGAYIIERLTGTAACHITNAATTGFVDIERGDWNRELIAALGLAGISFPPIVPEKTPCGWYDPGRLNLPVHADIGDSHANVLGTLMRPGMDVNLNIATAAQVATIVEGIEVGPFEVRPFFDGAYLNSVTGIPAGRNLAVIASFYADIGRAVFGATLPADELWERISSLADGVADTSLAADVDFFMERPPNRGGALSGISPDNLLAASVFLAAYRNMADCYAKIIGAMPGGERRKRVVFSGGAARKNAGLRKTVSAVTGLGGVLAPHEHEVFVGLLRIALVCAGRCADHEETLHVLTQREQVVSRQENAGQAASAASRSPAASNR